MDKKQVIKYALIAVGVYLVYNYLKSSGQWDKWFGGQTALPAGTGVAPAVTAPPLSTNPAEVVQPSVKPAITAPATPTVVVVPDDATLMKAAYEKASAGTTGSYTLNGYQWNWYRQAAATAAGVFDPALHQPTLDDVVDMNSRMTAAQYHEALAKKGIDLSSLGWRRGVSNPLSTRMGGWQ